MYFRIRLKRLFGKRQLRDACLATGARSCRDIETFNPATFATVPFYLTFALGVAIGFFSPGSGWGQLVDRGLPGQDYYASLPRYYAANYGDSLKNFVRGANTAFKIGTETRFLDSACYWTMAGECHFHMGDFSEALGYYEQALNLIVEYSAGDWQARIQPIPAQAIQPDLAAIQRAGVTWYQSTRGDAVARIPNSFTMLFGRLDNDRVLLEGGVIQPPELRSVDHAEIMRCATLAVYRRYQIKGMTSHIDPFSSKLATGCAKLPRNTFVIGKWNSILSGLANWSLGRTDQAATAIQNGLRLENGLDHHLTPIALLTLAQIAYHQGDSVKAASLALEASHSAAVFNQFDLIEEALSLGTTIHLSQSRTAYPPLGPAIQWASRDRPRMLWTSLLVNQADNLIELDDSPNAKNTLAETRRIMSNTDLGRSPWGAKIRYLTAAIAMQDSQDGFPELTRSLEQLRRSSAWIFQLELVANSLAAGSITQRQAELAYERLLVDADEHNWRTRPRDTLTYLTTPHTGFMEQWFEILLARKNYEKAIEVAELVRRHRFYQSLPLGGRLLALRWVLTAPDDLLNANGLQQRKDVFARYPQLAQSVQRMDELQAQVRQLPLQPDADSPQQKQQQDWLVEIMNLARYQESMIAALAVRRQAADFIFPQPADFSQITQGIQDHQVVAASLQTSSGFHQFVLSQQSRQYLGVVRERDMRKAVATLYKQLGIDDANGVVDAAKFVSDDWKAAAADVKNLIFENYHDDQWTSYQELIVVPDGILWYVPYEILQLGANSLDWKNLGDPLKVRYLPMASALATADRRPPDDSRIAVVTGKLHSKGDPQLTQRAFEKLKDFITNATQFSTPIKIPSNLLNTTIDTLIVWHEGLQIDKAGVYGWPPFQLDQGRRGSTLAEWIQAPWRGPERVVLPAFSSGAAGGLKSRSVGNELFMACSGLMASGTRSILISRWRVGGEHSLELTRQFVLNSRESSVVEAWHTACLAARDLEVNQDQEIRIKPSKQVTAAYQAQHPFFWAGHLLVDLDGYLPPDPNADDDTSDSDDLADDMNDVAADERQDQDDEAQQTVDEDASGAPEDNGRSEATEPMSTGAEDEPPDDEDDGGKRPQG